MLEGWLENPIFPFPDLIHKSRFKKNRQHYRETIIRSFRRELKQSFVILNYKLANQMEGSQVAVFDPKTKLLVAICDYEFTDG
eukprot:scaffold14699_cov170-Amphora_coffeaeformis.AAC.11